MQSLDVISVNIWHILISLINLVLLFFILKKLLFKPVRNMVAQRQAELDQQYSAAAEAQRQALADRDTWNQKLQEADAQADAILQTAAATAKTRAEQIVREADAKAVTIVQQAEQEAALEKKKAEEEIKREIVDVSIAIAEKMLEKEVDAKEHRMLIGSFIDTIGEHDDGNQ